MSGPWDDKTPKTRWRMFWCGQWRPVLSMYDAGNVPTTMPLRASKVVLYAAMRDGEASMVVTSCGPADILADPTYKIGKWDPVH